jgi:hypothetical protein
VFCIECLKRSIHAVFREKMAEKPMDTALNAFVALENPNPTHVIPAAAGIQEVLRMTRGFCIQCSTSWIPAAAGMTAPQMFSLFRHL